MNSRGAYDEDEMLRRAIEESKYDGTGTLGKRTRDGDEEYVQTPEGAAGDVLISVSSKPAVKRQRTTSSAGSSSKSRSVSPSNVDGTVKGKSNLRGAAARNNREKEARDRAKADAVAAKAEAANRRNARSEKRRVEGTP